MRAATASAPAASVHGTQDCQAPLPILLAEGISAARHAALDITAGKGPPLWPRLTVLGRVSKGLLALPQASRTRLSRTKGTM